MNREKAIEAGARALARRLVLSNLEKEGRTATVEFVNRAVEFAWRDFVNDAIWVIDAASPHLTR